MDNKQFGIYLDFTELALSPIQSTLCNVHLLCLCLCAIAEYPLSGGLETSGCIDNKDMLPHHFFFFTGEHLNIVMGYGLYSESLGYFFLTLRMFQPNCERGHLPR